MQKATSLPLLCAASRTTRSIFWKVVVNGTMRRARLRSCRARTIVLTCLTLARNAGAPLCTIASSWATIACAIPKAPIISIRSSRCSVRTRTEDSMVPSPSIRCRWARRARATSGSEAVPARTSATPRGSAPQAAATVSTFCRSTVPSATKISPRRGGVGAMGSNAGVILAVSGSARTCSNSSKPAGGTSAAPPNTFCNACAHSLSMSAACSARSA